MDINQLLAIINSKNLIEIIFKAMAIFISFFYLLYAIVLFKQTQVMNKTLQTKGEKLILTISFFHIIFGIFLLFLSLFLL